MSYSHFFSLLSDTLCNTFIEIDFFVHLQIVSVKKSGN